MNEKQSVASKGLIVCVSGPSGVGKGTIIKEVLAMRPQIVHSVSVTTRPPRAGERNGIDYIFCDPDTFRNMLENGEILEYDLYCSHYYGTPKKQLEEKIAAGLDVVLDITVPGSLSLMRYYSDCVTLFLLPPSLSELQLRLQKRGTETEEMIHARLQKAREEIGMANRFQYLIVNDDKKKTAELILSIIDAEHCRYHRMAGIEQTIMAR